LIAFRDIGQKYYTAYVKYYLVRDLSAVVPLRLRRLLTFCAQRNSQRNTNQKEREQKLVSRCIRRQLAWSAQTQCIEQHRGEQYLELPRTICTPTGAPHNGQKSYVTKFLEKQYSHVVVSMFPGGWVPDSAVLEGMFLINTSPLVTHCTMKDYAQFLVRRFAVPHFSKGVTEVHIVFDSQGQNLRTPKAFEQCCRDAEHSVSPDHEHKWRDHLNCCHCKRQLVLYLGNAFLTHASELLSGEQKLVVAK